jgi:hypothetical protein
MVARDILESTPWPSIRRRLPHWQPGGKFIFLTWRLFGSLPAGLKSNPKESAGTSFIRLESALDCTSHGPRWLAEEPIARLIVGALHYGDNSLHLYRLSSWVLMPNHLHLLIFPLAELRRITHSLKNFTAVQANRILGRTGQPFWQDESFDHWVRDRNGLQRIQSYIENNPVKAGPKIGPGRAPVGHGSSLLNSSTRSHASIRKTKNR